MSTGKLTPVAVLAPVELGGATITSATLFNPAQIKRLGVRIGDDVVVSKAGDIIPQVKGVAAAGTTRKSIQIPAKCPVCGGPVGPKKNVDGSVTVDIYCLTDSCPARQRGKVARWIRSLGIKWIGAEILQALTTPAEDSSGPLVRDIADLYALPAAERLGLLKVNGKRLGISKAQSIHDEIDKTRTLTIDQLLGSIGICKLGKRRVEMIRQAAGGDLDRIEAWFSTE